MKAGEILAKDQIIRADGTEYRVAGGIEYYNTRDGSLWMEYKLLAADGRERWLSVDHVYREYAIYTQSPYSPDFCEDHILSGGYKKVDSGTARVQSCFGRADVREGQTVSYTEYEDPTEEWIISVERWPDGEEYAKGCYLDLDEIQIAGGTAPPSRSLSARKAGRILSVVLLAGVVLAAIFLYLHDKEQKSLISSYLKSNEQFSYVTSITSNTNQKEKADVYMAALTVEEAAQSIIRAINGETEEVQQSDEDSSVAILTAKEYCLVYEGEEGETFVQISTRAYAYHGNNRPYHSTVHTSSYYHRFYYSWGYPKDRNHYGGSHSGYDGFDGQAVASDPSDPYRSYSYSVRQSSINTRTSTGGGLSPGK